MASPPAEPLPRERGGGGHDSRVAAGSGGAAWRGRPRFDRAAAVQGRNVPFSRWIRWPLRCHTHPLPVCTNCVGEGCKKFCKAGQNWRAWTLILFLFFFWWGGKKRRCNFTHALSFMSKYFYSCTFFFRDCKVVLLFGTLIRSTYYIYRCLDFLWEDIY